MEFQLFGHFRGDPGSKRGHEKIPQQWQAATTYVVVL